MKNRITNALEKSYEGNENQDTHDENDMDQEDNATLPPTSSTSIDLERLNGTSDPRLDNIHTNIYHITQEDRSGFLGGVIQSCHGATTTECYTAGYLPNTPFGTSQGNSLQYLSPNAEVLCLVSSVENLEEMIQDAMRDPSGDDEYEVLDIAPVEDLGPDKGLDSDSKASGSSRDINDADYLNF